MQTRSLLCLIVLSLTASVAGSFTFAQQAADSDSHAALEKLLTKRRDLLLQRVKSLDLMFAQGYFRPYTFLRAHDKILYA
jgi:hypothetical protein